MSIKGKRDTLLLLSINYNINLFAFIRYCLILSDFISVSLVTISNIDYIPFVFKNYFSFIQVLYIKFILRSLNSLGFFSNTYFSQYLLHKFINVKYGFLACFAQIKI